MVLLKFAPACVGAVLSLPLALAAAHADGRLLTAKATASNPYRLVEREANSSTTMTPARMTSTNISSTTINARWTEPPTFALAPRTIGISFGANYFHRSAYAGPAQRGRAYNVRRKES